MPLRLAVLLCAAGLLATVLVFRVFAPGETATEASPPSPAGMWQLAELGDAAVDAGPLLILGEDGEVAGDTGCNAFSGTYEAGAGTFSFGPLAMTRRACLDAAANAREAAYMQALAASAGFAREDEGGLTLYADGTALARFAAVAAGDPVTFDCDDGGTIVALFLEGRPPRAYFTRDGDEVLAVHTTLTRTGSGTRYVGDGVDFWNKGAEVRVDWRGEELTCRER